MTHPNKQRGNRAELAVVEHLRAAGWPYAERSRAGWTADRGDIDGIPGVVVEVKDQAKHALPAWLKELEVEVANARAEVGVLVVKRRGIADAGKWYAVMPLEKWTELAKAAGW